MAIVATLDNVLIEKKGSIMDKKVALVKVTYVDTSTHNTDNNTMPVRSRIFQCEESVDQDRIITVEQTPTGEVMFNVDFTKLISNPIFSKAMESTAAHMTESVFRVLDMNGFPDLPSLKARKEKPTDKDVFDEAVRLGFSSAIMFIMTHELNMLFSTSPSYDVSEVKPPVKKEEGKVTHVEFGKKKK